MTLSSVPPDLKPINKISFGAAVSLVSVAIIALAKAGGFALDPVLAGAIATVVFSVVAYFVPQEYKSSLEYIDRVAEILAVMHPGLSQPEVAERIKKPTVTAQLISSASAIADLKRERLAK